MSKKRLFFAAMKEVRGMKGLVVTRSGEFGMRKKNGEVVALSCYRKNTRLNRDGMSWNADLLRMLAWGKVRVIFKDGNEENHEVDNLIVKLEVE